MRRFGSRVPESLLELVDIQFAGTDGNKIIGDGGPRWFFVACDDGCQEFAVCCINGVQFAAQCANINDAISDDRWGNNDIGQRDDPLLFARVQIDGVEMFMGRFAIATVRGDVDGFMVDGEAGAGELLIDGRVPERFAGDSIVAVESVLVETDTNDALIRFANGVDVTDIRKRAKALSTEGVQAIAVPIVGTDVDDVVNDAGGGEDTIIDCYCPAFMTTVRVNDVQGVFGMEIGSAIEDTRR